MILRLLFRVSFFLLISTGTYFLFQTLPYSLVPIPSQQATPDLLPAVYPEIIFLGASWFLLFSAVNNRLFVLLSLFVGQLSLYFLHTQFWLLGYSLPFYALVGGNLFYLVVLYFAFTQHLWAPEQMAPEVFDSGRPSV